MWRIWRQRRVSFWPIKVRTYLILFRAEDIVQDINEINGVEEEEEDDGGSDSGGDDDLQADVLDFEEQLLRSHYHFKLIKLLFLNRDNIPGDIDGEGGGDDEDEDEFLAEAENMLYRAFKNPINTKVTMLLNFIMCDHPCITVS